MTVLRRHLVHFYVVILMAHVIGVDSGHKVEESLHKLEQARHFPPENSFGRPVLRNRLLKRKPYLKITNTTGDVRKTSDQYKWPWKTYEEWKQNQERIENEIDRILVTARHVHPNNRTKIRNSKRRYKLGLNPRNKKHDTKKRSKRKRKMTLKKNNERISTNVEHESKVSSGGSVLSVKYYSTEDGVTDSVMNAKGKMLPTPPVVNSEILTRLHLLSQMRSRWHSKRKRGGECSINNGGCEGLCVQTKSSHYCHCPEGFRLDSSRRKCIDSNECLPRNGHGPCQGECLNEWGSFKCGCDSVPGTHLDSDGVTCVPIDRCSATDCSHICINTRSGAFCSCPENYILDDDWKTCKELLEGD